MWLGGQPRYLPGLLPQGLSLADLPFRNAGATPVGSRVMVLIITPLSSETNLTVIPPYYSETWDCDNFSEPRSPERLLIQHRITVV